MNVKAVIFDLDGTLLNTIEDLADSGNLALKSIGLPPFPIDDYYRFVGKGLDTAITRMLKKSGAGENRHRTLKEAFQRRYDRRKRNKTKPYPGINRTLRVLSENNITLGVLSNKNHRDTVDVINHFFPDVSFALVYGKKEEYPIKPDPTSLLVMLDKLGLKKNEVVYAGDTATDMLTAKRADVFAVGVLWGFRDKEELTEAGADAVIENPEELLGIVLGDDDHDSDF